MQPDCQQRNKIFLWKGAAIWSGSRTAYSSTLVEDVCREPPENLTVNVVTGRDVVIDEQPTFRPAAID
ncbi:hypothetical protein E2C01_081417 [Portunus trituberculatus]|uniref:Uncharacterized protein n=1 Tax=Portunus trituberculatus TaxID=210409 RepID=A0A5B7IWA0_PORTR|nr:hypothetical protein [Portunus trituberculatus]